MRTSPPAASLFRNVRRAERGRFFNAGSAFLIIAGKVLGRFTTPGASARLRLAGIQATEPDLHDAVNALFNVMSES